MKTTKLIQLVCLVLYLASPAQRALASECMPPAPEDWNQLMRHVQEDASPFSNMNIKTGMPRTKIEEQITPFSGYSPYSNNLEGGHVEYTDKGWVLAVDYAPGTPAPLTESGHELPVDETVLSYTISRHLDVKGTYALRDGRVNDKTLGISLTLKDDGTFSGLMDTWSAEYLTNGGEELSFGKQSVKGCWSVEEGVIKIREERDRIPQSAEFQTHEGTTKIILSDDETSP